MSNVIKQRLVSLDQQIKQNKRAYQKAIKTNAKNTNLVRGLVRQRLSLLEQFNRLTQSIKNTPITTAKSHVTVGNYFQNQAKN